MITTPGSDSQEVGPLADRMPRKRSTRFVARRRAEMLKSRDDAHATVIGRLRAELIGVTAREE
jgi:hypothetical protein